MEWVGGVWRVCRADLAGSKQLYLACSRSLGDLELKEIGFSKITTVTAELIAFIETRYGTAHTQVLYTATPKEDTFLEQLNNLNNASELFCFQPANLVADVRRAGPRVVGARDRWKHLVP